MFRNVSVIDPPFLVGLGLVTLLVFAASWVHQRRSWARWAVRGLGAGLAMLLLASAVNARYAYLPTVGAVFGNSATDQISPAQLRALELASGPASGVARRAVGIRLAASTGSVGPALGHGVVVAFQIPPTKSQFHARTAQVYLPPAYFRSPRPQLPVIELLHGTPGSPIDWTRSIFADVTADAYASQHHGVAPILVMPDINGTWTSDSECVNGTPGQVQTYLTVDVRNAVVARFHTRRDREGGRSPDSPKAATARCKSGCVTQTCTERSATSPARRDPRSRAVCSICFRARLHKPARKPRPTTRRSSCTTGTASCGRRSGSKLEPTT